MKIATWRELLQTEYDWLLAQTKPVVDGVNVKARMTEIETALKKHEHRDGEEEL